MQKHLNQNDTNKKTGPKCTHFGAKRKTRIQAELAFLLFLTQHTGPLGEIWEAVGLGTIPNPLWSGFLICKSKGSDWRSGSPIQFENLQVQKSPEDLWPPASRPLNHVGLS